MNSAQTSAADENNVRTSAMQEWDRRYFTNMVTNSVNGNIGSNLSGSAQYISDNPIHYTMHSTGFCNYRLSKIQHCIGYCAHMGLRTSRVDRPGSFPLLFSKGPNSCVKITWSARSRWWVLFDGVRVFYWNLEWPGAKLVSYLDMWDTQIVFLGVFCKQFAHLYPHHVSRWRWLVPAR